MMTLFIQDVSELSEPFDVPKPFDVSKPFELSKPFVALKLNPMSSLAHNWYINTHPHMHKAEAGERVRVSIFSTH
jgi:hypothetical protein